MSYLVAYDVAHQRRHAVCAALFATFSGFYMAHWVSTDNFAPFALAGALCLWATGRGLHTSDRTSYVRQPEYLAWARVLLAANDLGRAGKLLAHLEKETKASR